MASIDFLLISRSLSLLLLSSLFCPSLNPRPRCDLAACQMARRGWSRSDGGIVSSSLSVRGLNMLRLRPRLVDNITRHESIKALSGVMLLRQPPPLLFFSCNLAKCIFSGCYTDDFFYFFIICFQCLCLFV